MDRPVRQDPETRVVAMLPQNLYALDEEPYYYPDTFQDNIDVWQEQGDNWAAGGSEAVLRFTFPGFEPETQNCKTKTMR